MAVLTTLILFVDGMVGWLLFGDKLPQHCGNIGILVAAFIVLNVLIGVVLNSTEAAHEIERRRALAVGVLDAHTHLAPVAERIRTLRAALDKLEQELVLAQPRAGGAGRRR